MKGWPVGPEGAPTQPVPQGGALDWENGWAFGPSETDGLRPNKTSRRGRWLVVRLNWLRYAVRLRQA